MSYEIRLDIVGRESISQTITKAGQALQQLQQNASLAGGKVKAVNIRFAETQKTVGLMGTGLERASKKIGFAGFIISWSLGRMARSFGDLSKIMDLVWLPLVPEFQKGIIESSLRIAKFSQNLVETTPFLKTLAGGVGTVIPYFEILGSILSPVGAMGLGLDFAIKGLKALVKLPGKVKEALEGLPALSKKVGKFFEDISIEWHIFRANYLDPFKEKVGEALAPIADELKEVGGWFKEHVWDVAKKHLDDLEIFLKGVPDKIKEGLEGAEQFLKDKGAWFKTHVLDEAKKHLDNLETFLKGVPDKVDAALKGAETFLKEKGGWFKTHVLDAGQKHLDDLVTHLKGIPDKASKALADLEGYLSEKGEWFSTKFLIPAKDYLTEKAGSLIKFLEGVPKKADDALKSLGEFLDEKGEWFNTKVLKKAKDFLVDKADSLMNFLGGLPAKMTAAFTKIFEGATAAVAALGDSKIILAIKSGIAAAAQWIHNAAIAVWNALSGPAGWACLALAAAVGILAAAWILSANKQKEANEKLLEGTELSEDYTKANEDLADSIAGWREEQEKVEYPGGGGEGGGKKGLQRGGFVPRTGRYLLHAGETVVPAGGTTYMGGLSINIYGASDPTAVARTVEQTLLRYVRRRRGF